MSGTLNDLGADGTAYCQCNLSFDSGTEDEAQENADSPLKMSVRYVGPRPGRCLACGLPKRP